MLIFVIVPNRRSRRSRNYNIMRPLSFRSDELRSLLLRNKIATLDELKQALGTSVNVTVFRKLKPLAYLTSYSHRGRYYTLRDVARFCPASTSESHQRQSKLPIVVETSFSPLQCRCCWQGRS